MAKLVIQRDGKPVAEHRLERGRLSIGRKPSNGLRLQDPTVSGEHAVVTVADQVLIEDRGSTNGTYLNGEKIRSAAPLREGDVIRIGRHELRFVAEGMDLESTVIIPAPDTSVSGWLKVLEGPKAGEILELTRAHTTLGKPGEQVAVVARRAGGFVLLPVTTGNGPAPKVNGEPVGALSRPLEPGDVIEIAGSRLEFQLGD